MIEMSDVEARLGSLFDAVAHQVPDVPAAAWASRDEFENHDDDGRSPGPLYGDLEASSSSSRRQRVARRDK